jgi:predicted O-linked N-acetylglucosamine transferase (SPINDLY family)
LPDVRDRAGIAKDRHLYFCGQNPRKLHPDFDRLLADILRRDPNAVVALVQASKPYVTAALRSRMQANLAGNGDRIFWLPRMTQRDYLAWMAAADCVLDTPHYCGGANSTYDAFAIAAPIVTQIGAFHRGRYTAAAYSLMGFSDLTATSPADYVNRALAVAADRDFFRHCRRQIAERRGCLFGNASSADELQHWFLDAIAKIR